MVYHYLFVYFYLGKLIFSGFFNFKESIIRNIKCSNDINSEKSIDLPYNAHFAELLVPSL